MELIYKYKYTYLLISMKTTMAIISNPINTIAPKAMPEIHKISFDLIINLAMI